MHRYKNIQRNELKSEQSSVTTFPQDSVAGNVSMICMSEGLVERTDNDMLKLSAGHRRSLATTVSMHDGNTVLQRLISASAEQSGSSSGSFQGAYSILQLASHRGRGAAETTRREYHSNKSKLVVQRFGLLTDEQIRSAISYNNQKWSGEYRLQILTHLRGGPLQENARFDGEDVKKIANRQYSADPDSVDGKIGDTTAVTMFNDASNPLSFTTSNRPKPHQVKLIFYPGELENLGAWEEAHQRTGGNWRDSSGNAIDAPDGIGKLYVKVRGNLVASYDVRGGPPIKFTDGTHTADPTPAGNYRLGQKHAHTTKNWDMSQIPYGAELRWAHDGQNIQYRKTGSKHWIFATEIGDVRSLLKTPLQVEDLLDTSGAIPGEHWNGGLPKIYKMNDFGAHAWNLRRSNARTAYYVHTTPIDEMRTELGNSVSLDTSHGCLHIKPADRDTMMQSGYLQEGVRFIVKSYQAHLLPANTRADLMSGG